MRAYGDWKGNGHDQSGRFFAPWPQKDYHLPARHVGIEKLPRLKDAMVYQNDWESELGGLVTERILISAVLP